MLLGVDHCCVCKCLFLFVFACLVSGCEEKAEVPVLEPAQAQCARDEISEPGAAMSLATGEDATGLICPLEDQDWYQITIPDNDGVLRVDLELTTAISPIQPTYTVWARDGNGLPGEAVALPPATSVGPLLDQIHCLAPGDYLMQVSDRGNDEQDFRRPYRLSYSTGPDPDPAEPNGSFALATALTPGEPVTGAVSCRSDEDWFTIEVPEGRLMVLSLEAPVGNWEPRLRLQDAEGAQIVELVNRSNRVVATNLVRPQVLPGAGVYTLIVSDDDLLDADPDAPYTLRVDLIEDQDPNEPNNHPDEATPVSAEDITCGPEWGPWFEVQGTLGSPGDNDWFVVPVRSCRGGILEAELMMDHSPLSNRGRWELADQVQATLAVVRPERTSACGEDADCATLAVPCDDNWDCAGVGNLCLPEGLCAGAALCLPEGVCAANQVQRSYSCDPSAAACSRQTTAPPNVARVSVPILTQQDLWLRASDFQSNGEAPDNLYRMRVRVRRETDTNEPNNLYTSNLDQDLALERQPVVDVPVHDCTPRVDEEGNPLPMDCCDGSTWIEGAISYESDLDWFRYQHPCPGEDCMVRVKYELDRGPVDMVMNLYRGRRLWFSALDSEELMSQASMTGTLGGLAPDDRCFYAFEGHEGDPFYYHLLVRDLFALYGDPGSVRPDSRNQDPDQRYRFCVERIADGCQSPCVTSENGECSFP